MSWPSPRPLRNPEPPGPTTPVARRASALGDVLTKLDSLEWVGNIGWEPPAGGGGGPLFPDAPFDTFAYGRFQNTWVGVARTGGDVISGSFQFTSNASSINWSVPGGFGGAIYTDLTTPGAGLIIRQATTDNGVFIESGSGNPGSRRRILVEGDAAGGGIPDAPADNTLYWRRNNAWTNAGGVITGTVSIQSPTTGTPQGITWTPGNSAIYEQTIAGNSDLVLRQPTGDRGVFIENQGAPFNRRRILVDGDIPPAVDLIPLLPRDGSREMIGQLNSANNISFFVPNNTGVRWQLGGSGIYEEATDNTLTLRQGQGNNGVWIINDAGNVPSRRRVTTTDDLTGFLRITGNPQGIADLQDRLLVENNGSTNNPALMIGEASTGFHRQGNALILTTASVLSLQIIPSTNILNNMIQIAGTLNMSGQRIQNVGASTVGSDGISRNEGDTRYLRPDAGGTISAPISLGFDPITPANAVHRQFVIDQIAGVTATSAFRTEVWAGPPAVQNISIVTNSVAPQQFFDANFALPPSGLRFILITFDPTFTSTETQGQWGLIYSIFVAGIPYNVESPIAAYKFPQSGNGFMRTPVKFKVAVDATQTPIRIQGFVRCPLPANPPAATNLVQVSTTGAAAGDLQTIVTVQDLGPV